MKMVQNQISILLLAAVSLCHGQSLFYYVRNNHPSIFHQQTFYPNQQPFIRSLPFGPIRNREQRQTSQQVPYRSLPPQFFPFQQQNFLQPQQFRQQQQGRRVPPPFSGPQFESQRQIIQDPIPGPEQQQQQQQQSFQQQRPLLVQPTNFRPSQPAPIFGGPPASFLQHQGPRPHVNTLVQPFGYYYTIGSGNNDGTGGQAYTTVTFTMGSPNDKSPGPFRPLSLQDFNANIKSTGIKNPASSDIKEKTPSNAVNYFSIVNRNPAAQKPEPEKLKPIIDEKPIEELVEEVKSEEIQAPAEEEVKSEEVQSEENEGKKDSAVQKSVEIAIDKLIGSPSFDSSSTLRQQQIEQHVQQQIAQRPAQRPILQQQQFQPFIQQIQQQLQQQQQQQQITPQPPQYTVEQFPFFRNRFVRPNFEFFPATNVEVGSIPPSSSGQQIFFQTTSTTTESAPETTTNEIATETEIPSTSTTTSRPELRVRPSHFQSLRRKPTSVPITSVSNPAEKQQQKPILRTVRRRIQKKRIQPAASSSVSSSFEQSEEKFATRIINSVPHHVLRTKDGRRRKKLRTSTTPSPTTTASPTDSQQTTTTTQEVETKTEIQQSSSFEESPLILPSEVESTSLSFSSNTEEVTENPSTETEASITSTTTTIAPKRRARKRIILKAQRQSDSDV